MIKFLLTFIVLAYIVYRLFPIKTFYEKNDKNWYDRINDK